jgi:hypothetical protein
MYEIFCIIINVSLIVGSAIFVNLNLFQVPIKYFRPKAEDAEINSA